MSRRIIFGDVHGCIDEFLELMEKIDLKPTDELYSIGDLIDRGPDSAAVVRKCRELSEYCKFQLILGNHEEKFLRYLHHLETGSGLEQQMKGTDEFPALIDGIGEAEILLLKRAFYTLALKEDNILLLHGGLSETLKFPFPESYQYGVHSPKTFKGLDLLTKVRYLTPEGNFVSLNKESENDRYWAEIYSGSFGHIYFGHQPFLQETSQEFPHATCLDTGCVFGGWLSAVIIDGPLRSFISVKSREEYVVKK
ncbi:MAG: metallophosphoesterase [Cryomorphaceae bacterium]|jgi:hypothetical protein|nr:metallophosphoesterase [Cryomorphaceae bacterium]